MDTIYHSGERRVQKEAGAVAAATAMERQVLPFIAHIYVNFIHSQQFVIVGSVDSRSMAWSSILFGKPGFMQVTDDTTLRIDALPHDHDPLSTTLHNGADVGLLLLDFSTRRRLRINGRIIKREMGFMVRPRQVYANCPRYIQSRTCESLAEAPASPRTVRETSILNEKLSKRVGLADTFFVTSYHPAGGADASHRGGFPGFVQVLDESTIVWPDYNGNGMFNTLGNIIENPSCGLLFLDFETGGTLQLSGTATIVWDKERAAFFPGAERLVEFRIKKVIETENATGLRWSLVEYALENPWFC